MRCQRLRGVPLGNADDFLAMAFNNESPFSSFNVTKCGKHLTKSNATSVKFNIYIYISSNHIIYLNFILLSCQNYIIILGEKDISYSYMLVM